MKGHHQTNPPGVDRAMAGATSPRTPASSPAARAAAALLAVSGLLLCGCQTMTYTGPTGERFSRTCFGTTTAIAALTVETGTNGIRRVELQGYQNDANQALGTVTEAAVRAALATAPAPQ